nr:hypothetical protein [Deinococcota bacterium]
MLEPEAVSPGEHRVIYKRSDKIVAADKTGDADNTGPADAQLSSGDAPNDAPKSANKDALQARQVPEGNYRNIFENAAEGIYRSS